MNWETAIVQMLPYLMKTEVPGGHGTGFICACDHRIGHIAIATARHAIYGARKERQEIPPGVDAMAGAHRCHEGRIGE